jgi:hypothetical protein
LHLFHMAYPSLLLIPGRRNNTGIRVLMFQF